MVSFIAPLRMAYRVDQFSYLIYKKQAPDEKVMRFISFQIFEPIHTGQTSLAYCLDRFKQM
jgi:hypothetical protein